MGTSAPGLQTLQDLLEWCRSAPPGTRLEAQTLADLLEQIEPVNISDRNNPSTGPVTTNLGWRERIWVVPAETRLGTTELSEALGRPKHWIYTRTQTNSEDPIPHRKLDGVLQFTAGEVRTWIRERESPVAGVPMSSASNDDDLPYRGRPVLEREA